MAKYYRKQELSQLGIEHLSEATNEEIADYLVASQLHIHSRWILPQMVAVFGQWQVLETCRETVRHNCKTDFQRALYRISRLPRSLLIKTQTREPQYAQLTPLILLGLKNSKNIAYSSWQHKPDRHLVIEPQILEVLENAPQPQLTREELLEIREQGLLIRSGDNQGKMRAPESTWRLYGIQDTRLGDCPVQQQTALLQCWLAHPTLRHENMLVNPYDWDRLPEPLITANPLQVATSRTKKRAVEEVLPWHDTV